MYMAWKQEGYYAAWSRIITSKHLNLKGILQNGPAMNLQGSLLQASMAMHA